MVDQVQHWVRGARTDGAGTRTLPVTNPSTGSVEREVLCADGTDVVDAVNAAATAAVEWSQVSPLRRARILSAFHRIVDDRTDELAAAISREHGKPWDDARGEVARGNEVVEYAAGAPELMKGEHSDHVATGVASHSARRPLGVVAGITPFNFPAMVPMWMFPMALACGNAFLLKPSERAPSASLLLAEYLQEAGLPDGVFNVLQGDRTVVEELLDHPEIRAISFVGSTPVARGIYTRAAASGKRVQALGGAKNHALVMPDAPLDLAADAIVGAVYGSTGQRCMALSAIVALDEIADPLLDLIVERARRLRLGPWDDSSTDMGPLVSREAAERAERLVTLGSEQGAEVLLDGRGAQVPGYESGFFTGPTVLDRVTVDMDVYREEVFGPVLCGLRVASFDEGLQLINDSPYGNGAVIFTESGGWARQFEEGVTAGMVGVNVPVPVPMAFHSFGGWKASLFGDTHMHGPEAIHFYTRQKQVSSRWNGVEATAGGVRLSFPSSAN